LSYFGSEGLGIAGLPRIFGVKVFWFFFSKKNCFLPRATQPASFCQHYDIASAAPDS
jgi:hypothetical protein